MTSQKSPDILKIYEMLLIIIIGTVIQLSVTTLIIERNIL